jgi:hypothetical protein
MMVTLREAMIDARNAQNHVLNVRLRKNARNVPLIEHRYHFAYVLNLTSRRLTLHAILATKNALFARSLTYSVKAAVLIALILLFVVARRDISLMTKNVHSVMLDV